MSTDPTLDAARADRPTLPTLPSVPPATSQSAPTSAVALAEPLPTLPTLPTPTPNVPATVSPHLTPHQSWPVAPSAGRGSRSRRPAPWWHTLVRVTVLTVVLAGLGVAGYLVLDGIRSHDALPEYAGAVRPTYGTSVVAIDGSFDGEAIVATLTSDATGDIWRMQGRMAADEIDIWTDGVRVWARGGDGTAIEVPALAGSGADAIASLGRVYVFADIVPTGSEQYFDVVGREQLVDGERELERVALVVATQRFRSEQPTAYASWFAAGAPGDAVPERVSVTVDVDRDGVVWRLESNDAATGERAVITVEALTPEAFTIEDPAAPAATVPAATAPAATAPAAGAGGEEGCWDTMFCGGAMPAGGGIEPEPQMGEVKVQNSELTIIVPPSGG